MNKLIDHYKEGELILRVISPNDIDCTLEWRNHNLHRQWFNTINIISKKEHYDWFKKYQNTESDLIFIVTNSKKIMYGQLSIYKIDQKKNTAEFGRFLANPLYENNGFMKKACRAALNLAKKILELKTLTLEVKQDNQKAIHIYTSCGFVSSGLNKNGLLSMEINL